MIRRTYIRPGIRVVRINLYQHLLDDDENLNFSNAVPVSGSGAEVGGKDAVGFDENDGWSSVQQRSVWED